MKLAFNCDYLEGAHEKILKRLIDTNREKTVGYGDDPYCAMAAEKIRAACGQPNAGVYFFVGGTPANATIIDGILRNYQGVISADTGHINGHEASFGFAQQGRQTAAGICGKLFKGLLRQ